MNSNKKVSNKVVYVILYHEDVDGGFGDAVPTETPVAVFDVKSQAEKYVKEHSNPHIYDKPYASLETGLLTIETFLLNSPRAIDLAQLEN
jgi:hypothetical protein